MMKGGEAEFSIQKMGASENGEQIEARGFQELRFCCQKSLAADARVVDHNFYWIFF